MSGKIEMVAFSKTMKELLQQYGVDVVSKLNVCGEKTGRETKKRLRADKTFNNTGAYRAG